MPRVSVIIPTYDRPHLLSGAVESARAAGQDVEIIVVDDASVDNTAEVCRGLKDIRYVRLDRRQGVAGARNVGVLASTSEFISFLDDDDLRLPGSLDYQVAKLLNHPQAGLVCGPVLMSDQEGHLTGEIESPPQGEGDVFWEMLAFNFPALPITVVVRRECFFRVGLFNRRLPGIDDWELWVRIAELFPVAVVDEPVSIYRKSTPHSNQGSSKLARQYSMVAEQQLRLLRLPRAMAAPSSQRRKTRREALNRISDQLVSSAAVWLPKGEYAYALSNLVTSFRLNPLWPTRPKVFKSILKRCWQLASK